MPGPLRMTTKVDTARAFAQLDAARDRIRVARARALNKLADQGETAGLRAINDEYQVGVGVLRAFFSRRVATPDNNEAAIVVAGKRLPMSAFKPIATPRGISVLIKGRRILIPHAFFSKLFGGVVARGAYGSSGKDIRPRGDRFQSFIFGRGRLPVSALEGLSPADAFAARSVVDAVQNRIDEQAAAILQRELDAVARGF